METTITFQWNDATITVRRAKTRDRLAEDTFQMKLAPGDTDVSEKIAARTYGQFCSQSSVEGDVGFPLLPATTPEEEMRKGFEAWLDAGSELTELWQKKLNTVNAKLHPEEAKNQKKGSAAK